MGKGETDLSVDLSGDEDFRWCVIFFKVPVMVVWDYRGMRV